MPPTARPARSPRAARPAAAPRRPRLHRPDATPEAPADAPPAGTAPPLSPPRAYLALRRVLDLLGVAVLAGPLGLVTLVAAVVVKRDSPGPAFYTQTRVGRGGRHFRIIKVRTMRTDAEAAGRAVWSGAGDPRVTRVGRFLRKSHIDELPQLWNVLRGEMTLIGPRPERPEFVTGLVRQVPGYQLRTTVKPGVTGLAQLRLPPDQTVDDVREKVAHDVHYICHMGVRLDGQVALGTLRLLAKEIHRACGAPLRLPCGETVKDTARRYVAAVDAAVDSCVDPAADPAHARPHARPAASRL